MSQKEQKNNANIETSTENWENQYNSYEDYIMGLTEGFISKIFNNGIIQDVKVEDIQKWLASPDRYYKKISNLMNYYYISNGDIFQLYDLAILLPSLNHKIECFNKANKNYEKHMQICRKALKSVGHRQLTRDLISQVISTGTVVAMWINEKKSPYLYIFEDLDMCYPSYKLNGKWVAVFDMREFNKLKDIEKRQYYKNLYPYITEEMYINYSKNMMNDEYRYIELPIDRTGVLRTRTLTNKQRLGIPWGTQGLFDMQHKKRLKDLEIAICNKIINAITILTIGSKDDKDTRSMSLNKGLKQKITARVKQALEQNDGKGISVISLPEFADIKFPEMKNSEALDSKKYDAVNDDISSANGLSKALTNGNGGNFANSKINLDILYKRLGLLLENIEVEIYDKLLQLILPSSVKDDYSFVYEKEMPLTNKEKLDVLMKLHNMEGFALKPVIDNLNGIDFDTYIEESIYEQEEMNLPDRIKPYSSLYTNSASATADLADSNTKPTNDNSDNENTNRTKANGGNTMDYSV